MKPAAIWAVSLLIVGVSSWLLFNQGPPGTTHSTEVTVAESANTAATVKPLIVDSIPEAESAAVTTLRERIEDLAATLSAIAVERESAEAALERAERDVSELEQFIEEIKARGEDPADYADEGLAMFQPAFYAYQDAFDKLELAEALEQTATEELVAAEAELAKTLAEVDTGK